MYPFQGVVLNDVIRLLSSRSPSDKISEFRFLFVSDFNFPSVSSTIVTMAAPQYKMLFFFARNPKLSPAEFKDYYENKHFPLLQSLVETMPQHGIDTSSKPLLYKRRYIDHEASDPKAGNPGTFGAHLPPIEFDVVMELVFQDKEKAGGFAKVLYGIEENAKKIVADEEVLFDRAKMRGVVVEEFGTGF